MKVSFALVTVLAGLALASPTASAVDTKAVDTAAVDTAAVDTAVVDTDSVDEVVEVQGLDPNCVSCVRRRCGTAARVCLRATVPAGIAACLAAACGVSYVLCCL